MTVAGAYNGDMGVSTSAAGPMELQPRSAVFTTHVDIEPSLREVAGGVDPVHGLTVDIVDPEQVFGRLQNLRRQHKLGRAIPCLGDLAIDADTGEAAFDAEAGLSYEGLVDPDNDMRLVQVQTMSPDGIDLFAGAVVEHLSSR